MKYFCGVCTFKQGWEQVTSAFWRRYPNPWSKHVLSEDVVVRKIEDDKLISKRLLTKTNRLPRWGERFVGSRVACLIEESVVDPVTKTFTTYTRNITFTRLMVVIEKCVYTVNPINKEWTSCHKEAWVSSDVFGLARAIEKFGVERYKSNAIKAQHGLEYVIEKLYVPEKPQVIPTLPIPQSNVVG